MTTSKDEASSSTSGEIEFDPPLGKMPPFAFKSPVMTGAAARWNKGGGSNGLLRIMREEENVGSYSVFLRFTAAMVLVPAIIMYVAYQFVLDRIFTFSTNGDRMAYAGIAAIVSVQLVIIAFLIYAFNEDPKPKTKSS